ncbi:unnamed protein product [Rhizophagus irregularis]|nr:unnamed protein product [Rhizophagus irregularis]
MSTKLSNLLFEGYAKILETVHSPYFRSAFLNYWIRIENNIIRFQKPNISGEVFEILIKYMYSGKLELANNDIKTNIAILIAADELCLDELCSYIENFLLIDKESIKSNFNFILYTTNKFEQFIKLSQFCKESFQENPSLVLRANDFVTIEQEYFIEYLTKNNDSLKQIEVWDKLMEWAIAKSNNELPSDITMWTIDNITIFDTLIQPFISLINFQKISHY